MWRLYDLKKKSVHAIINGCSEICSYAQTSTLADALFLFKPVDVLLRY